MPRLKRDDALIVTRTGRLYTRPQFCILPNMIPQVTLAQIAEAAGVSSMTVSRALRNQPRLAKETRDNILRIAKELEYRPNPLVSTLMQYRRQRNQTQQGLVLAFLTCFPERGGWRKIKHHAELFEGAAEAARQRGYRLEEFWLREPGMTGRRMSEILYSRNIPGLLVPPLPYAFGHLRLEWERFSAVAVGYTLARPVLHRAVTDKFRGMRMAVHHLWKRGYRKIGLALRESMDNRVANQWVGAFLVERQHRPMGEFPMLVLPDHSWQQKALAEWFDTARPEVIVTHHEEVPEWLRAAGHSVPEEVGICHLNCPDEQFAGMNQHSQALGRAAIDLVVTLLQCNERGVPPAPQSILVDGVFQEGPTLMPHCPQIRLRKASLDRMRPSHAAEMSSLFALGSEKGGVEDIRGR
jgi:LacI family transcriptional regulator